MMRLNGNFSDEPAVIVPWMRRRNGGGGRVCDPLSPSSPVHIVNLDKCKKLTLGNDVACHNFFQLTTIISEGSSMRHSLCRLAAPPTRLPKLQMRDWLITKAGHCLYYTSYYSKYIYLTI